MDQGTTEIIETLNLILAQMATPARDQPHAEFSCASHATKAAISWPVGQMRILERFPAGGERPVRWDVAMDRRRRGELFVPVFAPATRILSDRGLDRQRAAQRSSIQ